MSEQTVILRSAAIDDLPGILEIYNHVMEHHFGL